MRCTYVNSLTNKQCQEEATAILEYELKGESSPTLYLCRHHATYTAEKIQSLGGSPRLGNV